MNRVALLMLVASACSSAPRLDQPVPARVAMDSAQIDRLCARPALVRVSLAECELKDQAPHIPISPLELR